MTVTEVATQPTDAERFRHILQAQRAAYLRDGAPSLAKRRNDLKRFKAGLLERRSAIEQAIDADFGNRSRHETAMMEVLGVVQGIDYLVRHLRRFMRPTRRHIALAAMSNTCPRPYCGGISATMPSQGCEPCERMCDSQARKAFSIVSTPSRNATCVVPENILARAASSSSLSKSMLAFCSAETSASTVVSARMS